MIKPIRVKEDWKELYFRDKPSGYYVSNLGQVRRPDGSLANMYYDKDGYTRFSLYIKKNDPLYKNKKAIRYAYKTHRAVAILFVENPDPEHNTIVCHKNDIRDCNIYLNLYWGTPQDNMDDKKYSGRDRYLHGEEKPEAIFTEKDVRELCELIFIQGVRNKKKIIKLMGYEDKPKSFLHSYKNLIANVSKKHCWKYIIKEYTDL
jgi:hypothetical protein